MTKEEEKAIEIVAKYLNFNEICGTRNFKEALETVLNMLKEKDKEIEELKQALARNIAKNFTSSMKESAKSKDDLEMLNKGWQIELEKKNKQIDLMAEYIDSNNYVDNEECQFQWDFNIKKCIENGDCKDCIKQYFERKSKE